MIKALFKTVSVVLLVGLALGTYGIYAARALPEWFDPKMAETDYVRQAVEAEFGRVGATMLAEKSIDLLRGRVNFTESEFNALVLASLESDPDGKKLLQVSDGVRAFLHRGEVELSAVINLEKLGRLEPKAREAVERFDKIFWIIEDGRISVSVYGQPVVRHGALGIRDTFRAKVGEIDFSNATLRSLNVPVEDANTTQLAINYLSLESVAVSADNINFDVQARF